MEKNKHLSLKGIGPAYVITITVISALFIFLGTLLPTIHLPDILLKILGIFLIIEGVYIWLMAVKKSKITEKIKNNTLVTDGIYSYVRNPIYSAFMIVEWGILLILGNNG